MRSLSRTSILLPLLLLIPFMFTGCDAIGDVLEGAAWLIIIIIIIVIALIIWILKKIF